MYMEVLVQVEMLYAALVASNHPFKNSKTLIPRSKKNNNRVSREGKIAISGLSRKEFFRLLHEIKGHLTFLCTLTPIKTMY